MTLFFQKSNFCGNFITFFEGVKITITKYLLNVTSDLQTRCRIQKVFAVETTPCAVS